MDITTIRDRVSSVCAKTPFKFKLAKTPFSFELQPSGEVDQVFRIESESDNVIGGFNYREDRTDQVHVWVARKFKADPETMYRMLLNDASSVRAAVIRDGHQQSGEYSVPSEGGGMTIQRQEGAEYAVLRVMVPVNYELSV